MECHKCEWSERLAADPKAFVNLAWELTPCAKCLLKDDPQHYPLSFDEALGGATCGGPDQTNGDEEQLPLNVLAEALRVLFGLPRGVLEVVRLRFNGAEYNEIAEELGVKRSTAEMRLLRAVRTQPVLRALFLGRFKRRGLRRKEYLRKKSRRGKPGAGEKR